MPIYEYYCERCKTTHERQFKVTDHPRKIKCSHIIEGEHGTILDCCGIANKIMSASHFKGSGDGWNGDDK